MNINDLPAGSYKRVLPPMPTNINSLPSTSYQVVDPNQAAQALGHSNGIIGSLFGGLVNAASDFGQGVAKGLISTGAEMSNMGQEFASNVTRPIIGPAATLNQKDLQTQDAIKQNLQPSNTSEQAGFTTEKVGEFLAPAGLEEKTITKATPLLESIPKALGLTGKAASATLAALKTALRTVTSGTSMGAVTAAQTGGDTEQVKTAAEFGAATGPLTALKYTKGFLPDVLSFTGGIPKGAVEKAMESPESLKIGKNMTMEQVRDKAVSAVATIDKAMKEKFSQGLDKLQKAEPFRKGAFNNAKGFFKTALSDVKEGIPSIFNKFGVSVQDGGKTLDFEKLNSPIVKSTEQNNLQKAMDTINRQIDFSPRGIQRVAARLEALTKYGENNETSAIITQMKNSYDKAIEKGFPELGSLRKQYGQTSQKISEISSIVGKKFDSPKQVQTAVNRLTQIFNDDKETYLNTVKTLSEMTGTDFEGLVASDKFKQILPSYIRGIGGGGAVSLGSAAVAHFLNPLYLLALPLFSPAAIGKGIQMGEDIPAIGAAASRGAAGALDIANRPAENGTAQQGQ